MYIHDNLVLVLIGLEVSYLIIVEMNCQALGFISHFVSCMTIKRSVYMSTIDHVEIVYCALIVIKIYYLFHH